MPPKKRSRKAAQPQPVAAAASSYFFQDLAHMRAVRAERRTQLREEAAKRQREELPHPEEEKRPRSAAGAAVEAAPLAEAPVSEQVVSAKERLREEKAKLEAKILASVAGRSTKAGAELAELDFSVWKFIWQWKLLDNHLKSLDVRTGMLFEHQQLVRDIVVANGMVSWYRPINLEAQAWLLKGGQGNALLTKGKSSRFDCIAGLIPVDVRLSKLMKDPAAYDTHSLAYYQSNMDFVNELYDTQKTADAAIEEAYPDAVISAKIKQARIAVTALEAKMDQKIAFKDLEQYRSYIETANALPKQVPVQYTTKLSDEKEYSVYYLVTPEKQEQDKNVVGLHRPDVVFGKDNQPIFVIEKEGEYIAYNTTTHAFDRSYGEAGLPEGLNATPLQIMAYQQFELNEERMVRRKTPRMVTADYDEGASVALRVHPFMQKTELATDSFGVLALTEPFESMAALQTAVDGFTDATLCRHETDRNTTARDIATHGTMGRATEAQRAMLAYLRDATGWTINHGPEANSPVPQKFEPEETYPCFYPDGRIEMLTGSEETVCTFVNEQRAKGFPLAVNPRWDWKMDEAGRFSIPRERFEWEPVDHFLKESQLKADKVDKKYREQGDDAYEAFLSCDLDRLIDRVQAGEDLSELEQDYLLVVSHNMATEIVDILLRIELLRVQPTLVYPGLIDSYKYRVLSKDDKELYQQRIQGLMETLHERHTRVEIADHDDITAIVDFYGKMETALGELEKTTQEHASRHNRDEHIKEKLEQERQQKIHTLSQGLQKKRNVFQKISAEAIEEQFSSLIERKIVSLSDSPVFAAAGFSMRGK
ncbi:MAG: hypothetical protein A3H43_04090 [Gammaproteobacteria bacterium RIFCSPLOWO2_02_FULL_42_9]|nr:MAG: hypothetical protein A3H43_04090 [Gammaproteobacteria bacterium RIFCSPLOWO2_02_FULL_42_9]